MADIEKARQSGNTCFELPLPSLLAPQAAVTVTVAAVLAKAQTPRPAKITQGDPQRVVWETTAYLQTSYPVDSQTLKVRHRNATDSIYQDSPSHMRTVHASHRSERMSSVSARWQDPALSNF